MMCPVCPAAGVLGGWLGGYFGIFPPKHPKGRIFSAIITSSCILITIVSLKTFFNISLCKDGTFTLENIVLVVIKTLIMGVIDSVFVNYLLNRYVFPEPPPKQNGLNLEKFSDVVEQEPCHCHCKKEALAVN